MSFKIHLRNSCLIVFFALLLGPGLVYPQEMDEKARKYTRAVEFNYIDWTLEALLAKARQNDYSAFTEDAQATMVRVYIDQVAEVQTLNTQIAMIYADPSISDPIEYSKELVNKLNDKQDKLETLTPVVEAILQDQVSNILQGEGISIFSILFPPVLYRTSDLPLSLFISPRDHIQLDANISLLPGMSDAEKVMLEDRVESDLNVSALVEPVGGLGTYPTMIMLTSDLNWLVETIAHEWMHNYLALQPLGLNYDTTPELRTMNETTANLVGKEIGDKSIELHYPERIPSATTPTPIESVVQTSPPVFDFREEMWITREHVDRMLATGEIDEAEAYMEFRRRAFWDHGYLIRRINQAYFAFYGAYNDTPGGGASGEDPVGPAVVALREKCGSLGIFIKTIAEMNSYSQLETALTKPCD